MALLDVLKIAHLGYFDFLEEYSMYFTVILILNKLLSFDHGYTTYSVMLLYSVIVCRY